MLDINKLLDLSKSVAYQAGSRLINNLSEVNKNYIHSAEHPKEIKALADTVLEQDILKKLSATEFSILSEESGYISGKLDSKYWFIIDPLDGTFNFVKGLGPFATSIAFWENNKPIFGVIYDVSADDLYWGGEGLGSYCNGSEISASKISSKEKASICTGFPVRFNIDNENEIQQFWHLISPYAKVRMLGSAAVSLIHVAKGSADVYSEKNIMIWDVAAGLAIIEGAGGCIYSNAGTQKYSLNVFASNKDLFKYHKV